MEAENYKPIEGYPNYAISDLGNVKNTRTGLILKPSLTHNGYRFIGLSHNGVAKNFRVNRLVAIAFIPNPKSKRTVNHKNGVKIDNRVCNLGWLTHKENNEHAFREGITRIKLCTQDIIEIRDLLANTNTSKKEVAAIYGVTKLHINDILARRIWSYV